MSRIVDKPSVSWIVLLGAGLAVASALVLLGGPVGYRLGFLSLRVALLTLLRWGAYLAIGAAVVSIVGLIVTLARPKETRRGLTLAAVSLVVAAVVIAMPLRFRMGPPAPPIHDITTDTAEPPD